MPAVKGGAVETLLTQLIEQNELEGRMEFLCASIPDPAAQERARRYAHTRMIWVPPVDPLQAKLYGPWCGMQRRRGKMLPTDPWYNNVLPAVEVEQPDLVLAEGGDLTQFCGISAALGRERCLAHLHGHTAGSAFLDGIYTGALALSRYIKDEYLRTSALDPDRVRIWPNCIDTSRFTPAPPPAGLREKFGFAPDDFVLMFCGRLAQDKGIDQLLDALSHCAPQVKLLIVGSPFFGGQQESEFRSELCRMAERLQGRAVFTGYLPGEELPEYYRAVDAVCVPTVVQEAAGLVAIEAMASGKPVIATRSGGMPEYLQGSEAVLVELGEGLSIRLAGAIERLRTDPALCERMGRLGAQRAQEFSISAYYDTFLEICRYFGGSHG